MKKCPFCKADIEENARFCLYCMTSLDNKEVIEKTKCRHRQWLIIAIFVMLFALVAGIIWFALGKNDSATTADAHAKSKMTSKDASTDTGSILLDHENVTSNNDLSRFPIITGNDQPSSRNNSSLNQSGSQINIQTGSDKSNSSTTATGITSSNSQTINTNSNNSPSDASTTSPVLTVTYTYRDAKNGDDFYVYADLENAVVITGVSTVSETGEYIIPEKIDGKKVIAVMGGAFCDEHIKDTVKKVVVPASVKNIWNYAFSRCYNLTDIYFRGDAIYTEAQAFAPSSQRNGTLTIHCSANCNDRNFRYYKNSAAGYDAEYQEWNG